MGPCLLAVRATFQLTLESCPPFRMNGGWMGECVVLNAVAGSIVEDREIWLWWQKWRSAARVAGSETGHLGHL